MGSLSPCHTVLISPTNASSLLYVALCNFQQTSWQQQHTSNLLDVHDAPDVPCQDSKRRLTFMSVVREVMKGLSTHEFLLKFEPFFRQVVREEVERALSCHHSPRSLLNQIESHQARTWQLHFDDKLPSTIFTSSKIESEDNKQVKIVIRDTISKNVITSGPLSSLKIELLVLDGDFGPDDQEDWTAEEFNAKVVREREGKRPLVTGELVIPLREGVGFIGDVSFTDNSSWIRSRRFRLGAKTVQGVSTEVKIREARSEAFVVKDQRGESYKKHHPPYLNDEIWRLERIAKDGAFHKRLAAKGIVTVKDFLQLYYVDESSLRNALGGGISKRTWDTIIEHATACVLDDKLYLYSRDAGMLGLVINSIFKVVGVIIDGQNYQTLDKLNVPQLLVENLKKYAYKSRNDLIPLDELSAFGGSVLPSSLLADSYNSPSLSQQHLNFPGVQQDQLEMPSASNHMTALPYICDVQYGSQQEVSVAEFCPSMQILTPNLSNSLMKMDSFSGPYGTINSWAPSGSMGPVLQIGHAADNNSQEDTTIWQGNGLVVTPSNEAVGIVSSDFDIRISKNGKPKARWGMIWAVMKWGISVRREVAAKKTWRNAFLCEFLDNGF